VADFTLFEQEGNCFSRSHETLKQYCHSVKTLEKASGGMRCIANEALSLYGLDEPDKQMLIFQK
jgi:hypothetical protein